MATQLSTFIKFTIFACLLLLITRISCFLEQQAVGGKGAGGDAMSKEPKLTEIRLSGNSSGRLPLTSICHKYVASPFIV